MGFNLYLPMQTRWWAMGRVTDKYWYDLYLMRAEKKGHLIHEGEMACVRCGCKLECCEDNECDLTDMEPESNEER